MSRVELNVYLFRQRWACPWDSRLAYRRGLYLQLIANGVEGWGEAAPLPGFSSETLTDCWQALCLRLNGAAAEFPPALEWALHCATQAQPKRWQAQAAYPLLLGSDDDIRDRLSRWQGRLVQAKLKVGRQPLAADIARINWLHRDYPELTLRLDANERWSLDQAREFCRRVPSAAIEYLEQPCRDYADCRTLAQMNSVAVALDESLQRNEFIVEELPLFKTLVLKPMLLGWRTLQLTEWARRFSVGVSVSSSYETHLGLDHLAALAHAEHDLAPGLDTLKAFSGEVKKRAVLHWQGDGQRLDLV